MHIFFWSMNPLDRSLHQSEGSKMRCDGSERARLSNSRLFLSIFRQLPNKLLYQPLDVEVRGQVPLLVKSS